MNWLMENYVLLLQIISAIVGCGVLIVRITPTKKDDGFFKVVDDILNKIMTFLKIPNVRK